MAEPALIDTVAAPKGGNEVIAIVVPETVIGTEAKLLTVTALPALKETVAAPSGGSEVIFIEPLLIETEADVSPEIETIVPTARAGSDKI
jgi:hypothetical protein